MDEGGERREEGKKEKIANWSWKRGGKRDGRETQSAQCTVHRDGEMERERERGGESLCAL